MATKATTTNTATTNTTTNAQPAAQATWQPPAAVLPVQAKLPGLAGRTVPAVVWAACGPGTKGATLAQLQLAIGNLGLRGQHPAQGMLARFAKVHGCTVSVQGTGASAVYTVAPPAATK
jgi:hypothetical protein